MSNRIPALLSINGGYVDTASFLALHGLFAAHVTGNFVTLGASLVTGTSGAIAKLLALPVFCIVIVASRLLDQILRRRKLPALRTLIFFKIVLLTAAAALMIALGPFRNGDSWSAIGAGMILVSAMSIQNAAHRIHLPQAPPSTIMTGTTTQVMIDAADIWQDVAPETATIIRARLLRMGASLLSFAVGCGAAALLFAFFGNWCFALPPIIGVVVFSLLFERENRDL